MRAKPRQRATDDAREIVRERFGNPWENLDFTVDAACFHRCLPRPELRAAYAAEFPDEYLDLCGFKHLTIDYYQVSRMMETLEQGCFRRWNVNGFLRKYSPQPFDLPDLSSHMGMGRHGYRKAEHDALSHDVQLARAKWWVSCKLPITPAEIQFVRQYLPELATAAYECPADIWDAAHVPVTLETRPEASAAPPDQKPSPEWTGPRLIQ